LFRSVIISLAILFKRLDNYFLEVAAKLIKISQNPKEMGRFFDK